MFNDGDTVIHPRGNAIRSVVIAAVTPGDTCGDTVIPHKRKRNRLVFFWGRGYKGGAGYEGSEIIYFFTNSLNIRGTILTFGVRLK